MKLAFFRWITCLFFCVGTTVAAHSVTLYNKKDPIDAVRLLTLQEQLKEISGKIVDSEGAPLAGVNIYVKDNKNIGTTTDLNGRYSLEVPDNAKVVFSMVGFTEQEVDVSERNSINITLTPSTSELGETVVVAFGKQKRENVVGAVTTVNPTELKVPSSNLTTALAGKIAGMISYQRSGEPGEDNADFFIRGVTTFGYKKDPLILVDGIELTSTDLARMQVDDIENFSILKDATATALYGARGANGVILITTKSGSEGKAKVSLRLENSISSPTRVPDLVDPITYMQLNNEAVTTRNPLGVLPYSQQKVDNTITGADPLVYPANDWREMLFKDRTMNQRANLNVRGGGKVARYYIAATFNKDNGLLKVDHRNNFNNNINLKTVGLRSNVDVSLTNTTEVGIKIYSTFDDYNGPIRSGSHFYRLALRSDPVSFPAYFPIDDDHRNVHHILFGGTEDLMANPYAELMSGYKEYSRSLVLSQIDIDQDLSFITKGLNFNALFNTNRRAFFDVVRNYKPYFYRVGFYDRLNDTYTLESINEESGTEYLGYSEGPKEVKTSTYVQARTNYSRVFLEKHDVDAMLVFLLDNRLEANAGSLQLSLPQRNIGLSGRFAYAYDKRYFGEFDFGYNGSERFYKSNRFGFFPSIGLAWQVSNEKFWPFSESITNLKLRGTYGLIGNDAIGSAEERFFYLSDVNMDDASKGKNFGRDSKYSRNGVSMNRYGDPDITWENSYKMNIGMDLDLFNDVNIIIDYWKEKRTNILMKRSDIPMEMGLQNSAIPKSNIGEAEGDGFDFSIDYSKFINNHFWIKGRANFTYAVSRFLVYEEPEYRDAPWLSRVGQPLTQQWGYIAERLFIDDAEVANSPVQSFGILPRGGDIKYRDVNGDGQITTLDKVPIGYPTSPEIIYGFGFSGGYKAFDFSFFFQGLANESFWLDPGEATAPFVTTSYSGVGGEAMKNQMLAAYANDHWSENNRNPYALWPRLSTDVNPNNNQRSTWFMQDGQFLRLKNVEMGYSLPSKFIKKIGLETVRLYANGSNLFNFSKFKLWDVEMAGQGLDYPIQRVINFGVQVSL